MSNTLGLWILAALLNLNAKPLMLPLCLKTVGAEYTPQSTCRCFRVALVSALFALLTGWPLALLAPLAVSAGC